MKRNVLLAVLALFLCFTTLPVRTAAAEDELTRAMGLGIVSELPGDNLSPHARFSPCWTG